MVQTDRPRHPGWPHLQSRSGVFSMASHCGLQNFSPSRTVQLQLGCAHFLLLATVGSVLSARGLFLIPQPNSVSFFVSPDLRAIQRFKEISGERTVARKVTGVILLVYGLLLMESSDTRPLTSTVRR